MFYELARGLALVSVSLVVAVAVSLIALLAYDFYKSWQRGDVELEGSERIFFGSIAILTLAFGCAFNDAKAQVLDIPVHVGIEPSGMRVATEPNIVDMDFEIHFTPDSAKIAQLPGSFPHSYTCPSGYGAPTGGWLMDGHPTNSFDGKWMSTVSADGTLCYIDWPANGSRNRFEFFGLATDQMHVMTVAHDAGTLTVTVDDQTQVRTTGIVDPSYPNGGANGLAIGFEANGYDDRWGDRNFHGTIEYVRLGSELLLTSSRSTLEGDAALIGDPPPPACSNGLDDDGDGLIDLVDPGCADATDNDETDPPPPTECDINPNSVECACETTPHPACFACAIP